jgi:GSCFA family
MVANCHKLPAAAFRKRILKKEEIVKSFERAYAFFPPAAQIIFTVSPVRHWRDGAAENMRSKAVLLTAVHEIAEQYPNCHYFPAFEFLIDDLRDYRFYATDMLHPNELAVDYIWERFRETYFSKETIRILQELNELRLAMDHRPLFPQSGSYKKFQQDLELKRAAFRGKYPFIHI